jgi:hypothetical protein
MISRRGFLGWVGATPLLGRASPVLSSSAAAPRNSAVIIDDISASTDPIHLDIVLQGLSSRGVPATCILDLSRQPDGRLTREHPVTAILRNFSETLPGLVELCPLVRDLGTQIPYFQARATFEAQQALAYAVWGDRLPAGVCRNRVVACDEISNPTAPTGVRASGARTVLVRPSESSTVQSEAWALGIVRLIGGVRRGRDESTVEDRFGSKGEILFYLSMEELTRTPSKQLPLIVESVYQSVRPQKSNGWVVPLLAGDVQYRDAYNYRRNLSLHFFTKTGGEYEEELEEYRTRLSLTGISSSVGAMSEHYWVASQTPFGRRSSPLTPFASSIGEYDLAVGLWSIDAVGCSGLDDKNTLRFPTLFIEDQDGLNRLSEDLASADDLTITLPAGLLTNTKNQRVLEEALAGQLSGGFTSFEGVEAHARAIAPQGPYVTHHRRTATFIRSERPTKEIVLSKEQYIADAKIAWSYFEKWTNLKTGLCPATVNMTAGKPVLHKAVTMWDVGSHINALIAAHDIGLITKGEFRRAVKKIFPNLKGRLSQGRLLPQGWIVTDRIKWGIKDFDGCDAGRLLAALYNLDSHGVSDDLAASLVASWDLQDVVVDGVIYSVKDGEMVSTYKSHCAHYAAWAFRLWGIECLSPYETFLGRAPADGEMALLEAAGNIGPLGAEPLLLEALELGMSPESAYLAEVLFAAQWEEYRETGKLMCVSESPIDRPPWFVYAGLQLDARGRSWKIDTVESSAEHRSTAFAAENLTLSTKAAYLWAAYNPHEYSSLLLKTVQEKAKTVSGFRSSIYQATGAVTRNTDLNTNAVILQSIAHILRGD